MFKGVSEQRRRSIINAVGEPYERKSVQDFVQRARTCTDIARILHKRKYI